MRALVTGGAGFIGSHVVDRLRLAGVDVRIFDARPSPHHAAGEVDTVIGDVRDLDALRRASEGCDVIVHLAALADVDAVAKNTTEAEAVNARGTLNVLEASRGGSVKRVLYASTIWVYSDVTQQTVDEETPLHPPGHLYTATKLAGEMYCRSYAELYGVEYTILRFGIPYGPRSRPEAVVPRFIGKALAGEPLTIAGDGKASRRFVYVEDLADGVVRALAPAAANRVYNLVGHEDVTIREVAEEVRSHASGVEIVYGPGRSGDFGGVAVASERAARELGWRASTSFRDGLRRCWAWHLDQREGIPAPAPVPMRRKRSGVPLGALAAGGLLLIVAAMLVLYLPAGVVGVGREELETVIVTTLLALSAYFVGGRDLVPSQRHAAAAVRSIAALLTVALAVRWYSNVVGLAESDRDLAFLSLMTAMVTVAGLFAGHRYLRTTVWARGSDGQEHA